MDSLTLAFVRGLNDLLLLRTRTLRLRRLIRGRGLLVPRGSGGVALGALGPLGIGSAGRRVRLNLAAFLQLVGAVGDHYVARLKAVADAHLIARGQRHGYRLNLHGVICVHRLKVGGLWST